MKFLKTSCPTCGGTLEPTKENQNRHKCDHCGNEYILDGEMKIQKVIQKPSPASVPSTEKPDQNDETDETNDLFLSLPVFMILLFGCMAIAFIAITYSASMTNIDTLGRYEIPSQPVDSHFSCEDNSPAVAEFGFEHEPPILSVYPNIEGKNKWIINQEVQKLITGNTADGILTGAYIWVHCSTPNKLPEYYIQGFFATIYPPKDGQEVIFSK